MEKQVGSELGTFQMIDVAHKPETLRMARSEGWIQLTKASFDALCNGQNPKGDVLAMAEVAGLMALKKTSELLPLCHPLAIQHAKIRFEKQPEKLRIRVESQVQVIGRTGAEMEALMGLQGALMCIYDMSKAVDPLIEMGGMRLLEKRGGKSGHWLHPEIRPANHKVEKKKLPWEQMKVGVVTLSDRASKGVYEDKSGALLATTLKDWGVKEIEKILIPDEKEDFKSALKKLASQKTDLILCTGGTGFAPRDQSPETLLEICDREIPGFGELLRSSGSVFTPLSYLSRAQAAMLGQTIVICMPGSPKAVSEAMGALKYVLQTSIYVARGENPHE